MKNNSIILGSNCRKNNRLIRIIKKIIKTKFKNEKDLTVSMIITPKLGYKNKPRSELWKDAIQFCKRWNYEKKLNIKLEYIDCSRKENLKQFKKSIKSNHIIWVPGGDTLYLLYHLKKTGMDKLIYDRVKNNNVLYIGCCAGAIIAGETIFPAFISRQTTNSKKYYIKNMYKKKYWTKKKNQDALKLIPKLDFLTYCTSKNKVIKLNKIKNKTKKFYCISKYTPYIK